MGCLKEYLCGNILSWDISHLAEFKLLAFHVRFYKCWGHIEIPYILFYGVIPIRFKYRSYNSCIKWDRQFLLFILFYKTALITSLYVCLEGLVRLHSKPLLPQQKANRGGSTEGGGTCKGGWGTRPWVYFLHPGSNSHFLKTYKEMNKPTQRKSLSCSDSSVAPLCPQKRALAPPPRPARSLAHWLSQPGPSPSLNLEQVQMH